VKDVCEATKSVTVTVDAAINATYPEDQTICIGEQATLVATGGTKYTWSGSNGYNKENTTGKITVNPKDVGDIIYSVKIEKGKCSATGKSTVSVKALPKINSIIVTTNEEHKRDIALNIESEVDYEVSLDDETYGVPDIILQNVPIGWNLLYVKDEYSCKNSEEFYVEPIDIFPDKFFTPNGDGVNDKWEVLNLDLYSSYIVEIFDRHGKRLFIQRVGSFNTGEADVNGDEFKGWEGIYNGHQMPSDDYWYLITVEEIRKQYTGHFTLKR
jgi:gliding motility-associated-like protein